MIFRKLAIILIVIFNSTSFGCLGQAPVSAFSAIDTEGCAPFSVTFINSSVGATSYYWEFGDGTSSINSNPTVTYLTQGLFTVTLIVTDSAGDQDTLVINDFIHVVDDPISDFSAIQLGNCENDNVINFNNESMNASEYLWDFGDGSTVITENPTHTYAEPGSYSVTLIASNAVGCSHVKQIMSIVTIHSLPEVQFSVDQYASCDSNHVYQFTNLTASAVSSFWDFGTGSSSTTISPTNNFSSTGIFDVSLICTNSYGCKDTLTKTDLIENFEEPEIAIYASDFAVCEGDSIVFSDSTNNAVSYYWDLGSGIVDSNSTITKLYLDSGNYVVKLSVTDNNGCIGIDSVLIAVESSPIVDIIPSDSVICSGEAVVWTNNSINALYHSWNISGVGGSVSSEPSNIFSAPGSYDVEYRATSPNGCKTYVNKLILVNGSQSDFTFNQNMGCAPLDVQFMDNSVDAVSWYWIFGDGDTSSLINPSHVYNSDSAYSVSLITTGAFGCLDTTVKNSLIQITSDTLSIAIADTVSGCLPFSVDLSNNIIGSNSWLWNFGDGTSSTLAHPNHTYVTPGVYTITLTTQTSNGCYLVVDNYSTFNFEDFVSGFSAVEVSCDGLAVVFLDTTSNAISWAWDFGDGSFSNSQNPIHMFSDSGSQDIQLTVISSSGCMSSVLINNFINFANCTMNGSGIPPELIGEPVPGGGTTTVSDSNYTMYSCSPMSVYYYSPFVNATSWYWDFGDGTTSTAENNYHIYTVPGTYDVSLIVQTPSGPDSLEFLDYVVIRGPIADFISTIDYSCSSNSILFSDNSTNAIDWFWDFGDGSTSTISSQSHSYPSNDIIIPVSLEVTDTNGCRSFHSSLISLMSYNPTFAFEDTICLGESIDFRPLDTASYVYSWDFGDGFTSTDLLPSHIYQNSGTYQVSVQATHSLGCIDTYLLDSILVIGLDQDIIVSDSTVGCAGDLFVLSPTDTTADHYYWYVAPSNPVVFYEFDGEMMPEFETNHSFIYDVTLISSKGSCVDTVFIDSLIEVRRVNSNFNINQLDYCEPFLVEITSVGPTVVDWEWNYLGDTVNGVASFQTNIPSGETQFFLKVIDEIGCESEDSLAIFPDALIATIGSSDPTGCVPHSVDFLSESSNANSWFWDFGDGFTSNTESPTHTYLNAGSYDVTLIVGSPTGNCFDTILFPGYANVSFPNADFSFVGNFSCAPMIVEFTDLSSGATILNWDFGDGAISTMSNPNHVYNLPGYYDVSLTAIDSNGCTHTKSSPNAVFVPGPIADFTASQSTICDSSMVQFTDMSSSAVSWSWTFGDGNSSNVQHPNHMFDSQGWYTVALIVQDSMGCATSAIMDTMITVLESPKALFTVSDTLGCNPFTMTMIDQTVGADSWVWNMGDGSQFTSMPSAHYFSDTGEFNVSLVASLQGVCFDTFSVLVEVINFADASIDSVDVLCQQDSVVYLNSNQAGGIWSGVGVINSVTGIFDPNIAGSGSHTLFYTMPGSCGTMDSVEVIVLANQAATINAVSQLCEGQASITLSSLNAGGVWSGAGIVDSILGVFDPSESGIGSSIVYYVTSNGSCTDIDSVQIDVVVEANAAISPVDSQCENANPIFIYAAQNGGVWSGTGILNASTGEFDPSIAGPGVHTVIYEISGDCGDIDSVQIEVFEFIEATVTIPSAVCNSSDLFTISSTNLGGVWSGTGIVDSLQGEFDPAISGVGNFSITYTITNGLCSDQSISQVAVLPDEDASFNSIGPFCDNDGAQFLVAINSGGLYAGIGITNSSTGLFNPIVAGPGVHTITYSIGGLCGDTVSQDVIINPTPEIEITSSGLNGCSSLEVSFVSSSSISGGLYNWNFGNGVTSELPNPNITFGPGQFAVNLTLTSNEGCTDSIALPGLVNVLDSIPETPVIKRVSVLSNTSVVIDWEESVDPSFRSYNLFRKNITTGVFEEIEIVNVLGATSFVDEGLNTLQNVYCYKLIETDICDNYMEVLEAVEHCTMNISAEISGIHHANVSWTPYMGCSIASYELFRFESDDTTAIFIASLSPLITNYDDSTNYCNVAYSYKVRATEVCGGVLNSWSDSAGIIAPGIYDKQISNVIRATVVNDESVWVEWTVPEIASGFVDYYQILRSDDTTDFVSVGMVPDGVNGFNDETVDVFSERYFYRIQVVNGCPETNVVGDLGSSILLKATKLTETEGTLDWTPYKGWSSGVDYYEIQVLNEFNQWETVKIVNGSILQTIVHF